MELLNNIPPALLLIIGAIALLALPATARKVGAIALAALGFFAITQLSEGTRGNPEFLGHTLEMLRVDSTSKAFGYIFTISAFGPVVNCYWLGLPVCCFVLQLVCRLASL